MIRYKIGEVSKILGMSSETLRYYEDCGILTPHKDENTGYRYYTPWDLNVLINCRLHRSYGFSLNDVEKIMHQDSLDTLLDRYAAREREILKIVQEYQGILDKLAQQHHALVRAKADLGSFRTAQSPALFWLCHRCCYSYDCTPRALEVAQNWQNQMPLIDQSFLVPQFSGDPGESFCESLWGFSISPDRAQRLGLDVDAPVEYLPPQRCLHTVMTAGGKGTFLPAFSAQVLDALPRYNFRPAGDAIGRLIGQAHDEDGQVLRYFDVWIPVES